MSNVLALLLARSIDWSSYEVMSGPATAIGPALQALLTSRDFDEASAAWSHIEEQVFSQGDIYSAAEPTVSVPLAAFTQDPPRWIEGRVMDLLFFIVNGNSTTDPELRTRCHRQAREGLWLLTQWAITHQGWSRESALEIIATIAPDHHSLLRSALNLET